MDLLSFDNENLIICLKRKDRMKREKMKFALWGAVMLCLFSCGNEHDTVLYALKEMESRPMALHLDRMQCKYRGRDTLCLDSVMPKLRLVRYVDTTECSPCILDRMYYWNDLIKEAGRYDGKLRYIFIVAPKVLQLEDTYLSIEYSGLDSPVYVDTAYVLRKENPQIPVDPIYHTFLLNEKDSVILVGNPLENVEIENIFRHTIDSIINL